MEEGTHENRVIVLLCNRIQSTLGKEWPPHPPNCILFLKPPGWCNMLLSIPFVDFKLVHHGPFLFSFSLLLFFTYFWHTLLIDRFHEDNNRFHYNPDDQHVGSFPFPTRVSLPFTFCDPIFPQTLSCVYWANVDCCHTNEAKRSWDLQW
jgi:hypothetical protein